MSNTSRAPVILFMLSALALALSFLTLLLVSGMLKRYPGSGDFDKQIEAYLRANPQVLIESVEAFQRNQEVAAANELKSIVRERREEIFNDPLSPVLGNPNGDVTLVEFFDYNCPYCRKVPAVLAEAQKADNGLKIVLKEFPILGPGSEYAARAALASQKQGKYRDFHEALMAHSAAIDETSTLEIARRVGLDIDRLQKDMEDPAIAEALGRNLALAGDLRINGTPSFIIGDEIVRGLTDLATLQKHIAGTRVAPKG